MIDYKIILNILVQVIAGKNLTEQFNLNLKNYHNDVISNCNSYDYNIGKIKDISYGVIRYYYEIKLILDYLIKHEVKNIEIQLILFIAIYEIKYTKKPHFAIANDLVNLTYNITKQEKIKNFINAIIRNYLRNDIEIKNKLNNNIEYTLNFPLWWIKKIKQDYKLQYIEILNNLNLKPKYAIRVNARKMNILEYINILKSNNVEYSIFKDKIILESIGNVDLIPLFNEGVVSVQDVSAQKLIELIPILKHSYILDACCAPGGKMAQILEQYDVDDIKLLGIDLSKDRLIKAKETLNRLGLNSSNVVLKVADASKLNWWDLKEFDVIIADVPCSASGTVKKNPDIKLHRKLEYINNFVITQREIIINLWNTLKNGGTLVYITCSIFKEENRQNINYLKTKLNNFNIVKDLELLPTEYSDGFYYCIVQKGIAQKCKNIFKGE